MRQRRQTIEDFDHADELIAEGSAAEPTNRDVPLGDADTE